MPRAKKRSTEGSNFKENDSALPCRSYYSMNLDVLSPVGDCGKFLNFICEFETICENFLQWITYVDL